MLATLVFPPVASIMLLLIARRCRTYKDRTRWITYVRWLSVLVIFTVPLWWSLCVAIATFGARVGFISDVPFWILTLVPLTASTLIFRAIAYGSDAYVFGKRRTTRDIWRLTLWRTVSSISALLMVAVSIETIYTSRSALGLLWLLAAGVAALIGNRRLRTAEGFVPRAVKSGELYKRAHILSKRMGVQVNEVCVVPFGKGKLTNAFGGLAQIAITDDYGHWLHGSQLDFVVGHELAHLKHRDVLRALITISGAFVLLPIAAFFIPAMAIEWRLLFNFGGILLPLMTFLAVSRRCEYVADGLAVHVTGEPEAGIEALVNLYRRSEVPADTSKFFELFSTHPGLWRRINAIAELGNIPPQHLVQLREDAIHAFAVNEGQFR